MSTSTETNTEQIRFLGDRLEAQAETLAKVVNERNRLRTVLETIRDSFWSEGESYEDRVDTLQRLARLALRPTTTTGQEEG